MLSHNVIVKHCILPEGTLKSSEPEPRQRSWKPEPPQGRPGSPPGRCCQAPLGHRLATVRAPLGHRLGTVAPFGHRSDTVWTPLGCWRVAQVDPAEHQSWTHSRAIIFRKEYGPRRSRQAGQIVSRLRWRISAPLTNPTISRLCALYLKSQVAPERRKTPR